MEPTPNSESGLHSTHVHGDHETGPPQLGAIQPEEGTSFVTVDEYHVSDHAVNFPHDGVYDARRVRSRLYEALMIDDPHLVRSPGNEYNARGARSRRDNARTVRSVDNEGSDARGVLITHGEASIPDNADGVRSRRDNAHTMRSLDNEGRYARGVMSGRSVTLIPENTHTVRPLDNEGGDARGGLSRQGEASIPDNADGVRSRRDNADPVRSLDNEGGDARGVLIRQGEASIPDNADGVRNRLNNAHTMRSLDNEGCYARGVMSGRSVALIPENTHTVRSLDNEGGDARGVVSRQGEASIPDNADGVSSRRGNAHTARSSDNEGHDAQGVRSSRDALIVDIAHMVRSLDNECYDAQGVRSRRDNAPTARSSYNDGYDARGVGRCQEEELPLTSHHARSLRSFDYEGYDAGRVRNSQEGESLISHNARSLHSLDNAQCAMGRDMRQPERTALEHDYLPRRTGTVETVPVRSSDEYARLTRKPVYEPGTFTGKEVFESYLCHFEIAAEINCWNNREKAVFLAASLQGGAQESLMELSAAQRMDFGLLVAALSTRYAPRGQVELNRLKLKNKRQGAEETLTELAHSVKCLVRKVYPGASEETRRTLARDSFVDALKDAEVRFEVMKAQCESIDDALSVAARITELKTTEGVRGNYHGRHVRTFNVESEEDEKTSGLELESLVKELKVTVAGLRRDMADIAKERQTEKRRPPRQKSPSRRKRDSTFWNCGEDGHYRNNCPTMTEVNRREQEN